MVFIRKKGDLLLLTADGCIFVIDINSGKSYTVNIPKSVSQPNLTKSQELAPSKECRSIITFEVSKRGEYIAASLENKQVVVFDMDFSLLRNFNIPRMASKVCFSPSNDLVIADKAGDVTLYPQNEGENSVLLLGHLSVILDITFSECGKFIITCDRDEKIRVSHFPNAYNIASFCLGHREFVINVKVYKNVLISASGDGSIRFWDFKSGTQFDVMNTNDYVQETTLLESFSKQMDKDNVDVSVLPITNMQTCEINDDLYIAASLYNFHALLLFTYNMNTYKCSYFKSVKVMFPNDFYLGMELYVFSNNCLQFCNIDDNCELGINDVCKLVMKNSNCFKSVSNIDFLMLYKRKFDNVQEYLERKKMRINTKQPLLYSHCDILMSFKDVL